MQSDAPPFPVHIFRFSAILLLYTLFLDSSESGGFDIDLDLPVVAIVVLVILNWITYLTHLLCVDVFLIAVPTLRAFGRRNTGRRSSVCWPTWQS